MNVIDSRTTKRQFALTRKEEGEKFKIKCVYLPTAMTLQKKNRNKSKENRKQTKIKVSINKFRKKLINQILNENIQVNSYKTKKNINKTKI